MQTAWESFVLAKSVEARQQAEEIYTKLMEKLLSRIPCDVEDILKYHEISVRQSMEKFTMETAELISSNMEKDLNILTVIAVTLLALSIYTQTQVAQAHVTGGRDGTQKTFLWRRSATRSKPLPLDCRSLLTKKVPPFICH